MPEFPEPITEVQIIEQEGTVDVSFVVRGSDGSEVWGVAHRSQDIPAFLRRAADAIAPHLKIR